MHNTIGSNNIHHYKNSKSKSKQLFNPLYNTNRLNNNNNHKSNI